MSTGRRAAGSGFSLRQSARALIFRRFLFIYQPDRSTINNPEYNFLTLHSQAVKEYLSLLGWSLHQDLYNGYFYVINDLEANRLVLKSKPTAILLALRLIYDENSECAGLFQDVFCKEREILEKLATDFGTFRQKPNRDKFKPAMKSFDGHNKQREPMMAPATYLPAYYLFFRIPSESTS